MENSKYFRFANLNAADTRQRFLYGVIRMAKTKKKKHPQDKEYSKRMLTKIVNNSMLMMWASYVLAWFGKVDIAETLSKTIAASIIAVVVGYLAKSVIENISKNTTAFGSNVISYGHIDEQDNNIIDEEIKI